MPVKSKAQLYTEQNCYRYNIKSVLLGHLMETINKRCLLLLYYPDNRQNIGTQLVSLALLKPSYASLCDLSFIQQIQQVL